MTRAELIAIIRNKYESFLRRGKAIIEACNDYGLEQIQLAELASVSQETISKLKKCYENSSEEARGLCDDIQIDMLAFYELGLYVPLSDQTRVIALAGDLGKERESKRPIHRIGWQGRQSLRGRITTQDMRNAIREFKDKMREVRPELSAIRSKVGRKGGKAPKSTPSGFLAMSPETRDAVSRMGVQARRGMTLTIRLDKRLCFLDDCRAKPCPIRIKAFGVNYDACCWSHAMIICSDKLDEAEANS